MSKDNRFQLTEPQQRIFDAIVAYKRENGGASPTHRELCKSTGVKSTSHMNQHLHSLAALGYIERPTRYRRGIRVIGEQWSYDG